MVFSSVVVSPTRSRSSVTVEASASRVRSDSRRSSSTDFCCDAVIGFVPTRTACRTRQGKRFSSTMKLKGELLDGPNAPSPGTEISSMDCRV
jgi:hypothetical protein